jgi:hypothetical protein
VSVGGIDQTVNNYSITSANSGTLVLGAGVAAGTVVSVRAIVGVAASGNATQLQGRALANTTPTDGQVIVWDAANSTWKPATVSGGGSSVTFNGPGTHTFVWDGPTAMLSVSANSGTGTNGNQGAPEGNGADGIDGSSVSFFGYNLAGGLKGYGGGAAGYGYDGEGCNGYPGNGPCGGAGGLSGGNGGFGGTGGCGAEDGQSSGDLPSGDTRPLGGNGINGGGNGGNGGQSISYELPFFSGGGGGGGGDRSGGGGGGGGYDFRFGYNLNGIGGGGGLGTPGEIFTGAISVSSGTYPIVISEGAGTASITISW